MTRRTSRRRTSRAASRRRTSLRRNTSSALANTFFTVFAGILTQYDAQQMARETKRGGRGNIYRLGHYLKALHNIEESARVSEDGVSTAIQIRAAIDVNFTSGNPGDKLRKVVDAYLEHGTLPKYPVQKLAKNGLLDACTYCKASPGGKHKWWCKTLAKNGKGQISAEDFAAMQRGYNGLAKMAYDALGEARSKESDAAAVKWYKIAAKLHSEAALAAAPRDKQEHRDIAGGCLAEVKFRETRIRASRKTSRRR